MASRESRVGWSGKRGALACAIVWLCTAGALASPAPQPGINWVRLDGAEQCLSAAALAERVEARVRELQFAAPRDAELFVDGSVRRAAGDGWDVRLEVSGRDGTVHGRRDMHFDGDVCSVIDDGVALVIAVTLHPGAGLANAGIPLSTATAGSLDALFGAEPSEPSAADSAPVPAAPPPAAKEPRPARTRVRPQREREPSAWHVEVDVAGFGAFGQLPGASLGLAGHVSLEVANLWPIELGARVFREESARAQAPDDGESRFELMLASIATCPWSPSWLPALGLCAGFEAGRLRAESSGFAVVPPRTDGGIANLLASGVLRLRFADALYLRTGLSVVLPLIQHEYTYRSDAAETVRLYRMPQVAARLEIGAGVRF